MRLSWFSSLGITLWLLVACVPEQRKVVLQGQTQGTYYAVTYYDSRGRDFQPQIDSILRTFDLSVSMWEPASVISRVNAGDTLVEPDEWFIDIFRLSEEISAKTEGAFDFTVGPLVNAWGFGFKGKLKMDREKVDSLLQFVGYRAVKLDDQNRVVKPDGFRFDFNAIAQGYAVDVLGGFLSLQGINHYLIDIGGEILGKGHKPGNEPWIVGIEAPAADSLAERSIHTRVRLVDKALATSGSYRKYREENGFKYSHTIDPHTGYPVQHTLLSVSVLANDCATADAYATAFMIMGLEKSLEFLQSEPGLEAFFISDGGNGIFLISTTEGFKKIIQD